MDGPEFAEKFDDFVRLTERSYGQGRPIPPPEFVELEEIQDIADELELSESDVTLYHFLSDMQEQENALQGRSPWGACFNRSAVSLAGRLPVSDQKIEAFWDNPFVWDGMNCQWVAKWMDSPFVGIVYLLFPRVYRPYDRITAYNERMLRKDFYHPTRLSRRLCRLYYGEQDDEDWPDSYYNRKIIELRFRQIRGDRARIPFPEALEPPEYDMQDPPAYDQ